MSSIFQKLAEQALKELAKSVTTVIDDLQNAATDAGSKVPSKKAESQEGAAKRAAPDQDFLAWQPDADLTDLSKFGGSWQGLAREFYTDQQVAEEAIRFLETGEGSAKRPQRSTPRAKAALFVNVPPGDSQQRAFRLFYAPYDLSRGEPSLTSLLRDYAITLETKLTVADIEALTKSLGWRQDLLFNLLFETKRTRREEPLASVRDLSPFVERDHEKIRAVLQDPKHDHCIAWERLAMAERATRRFLSDEICAAATANSTALREQVAPLFDKLSFEQARAGLLAALDGAKPDQRARILIAAHAVGKGDEREEFASTVRDRLAKDRSKAVREALDYVSSGPVASDAAQAMSSLSKKVTQAEAPLTPGALVAMTQREMAKKNAVSKRILWLDFNTLPTVRWDDETEIPDETMAWFISDAARTQSTEPSELLQHHAASMNTDDLKALTSAVFWAFHAADSVKALPGAKGLMGFIAIAAPSDVITGIGTYVRKHRGKRLPQTTAMLHLLGYVESSSAIGLLLSFTSHRSRKVRVEANHVVSELTARRGLTPAQLADRFVTDAGFSGDGKQTFDYGGRSFTAMLADDLEVRLTDDESGRAYKSLPKGRAEEDAALTAEAKQRWAATKKDLEQVTKMQPLRLHEAMCAERTWSWAEFDEHFLQHPIVLRLASRLIWLGAPARFSNVAFRPLTDGTLLLADDEEFVPSPDTQVRIAHSHFFADESLVWRNHITDYEVVPLFPQFDRPRIEPSSADVFVDFEPFSFNDKGVASILMARNWRALYDAYERVTIRGFEKNLATIPLRVSLGWLRPGGSRTDMRAVASFVGASSRRSLKLSQVPPVALSEISADLRSVNG